MKKTILLFVIVLALTVFFACKTCVTCTTTASGTTQSEEKCGSKSEVKEFEDDKKAAAASVNSTVTCK